MDFRFFMTLATRRFLYIIFILAFIIITPLVIAYAAGYQFTLSWNIRAIQLQKTGMLILDSTPKGAKIFINGKSQQAFLKQFLAQAKIFGKGEDTITTPAKIKNLLPGEYDVKLELDGYWSWQKKLTVKGGESTYAEDVYLFRNNLPLLLKNADVKNFSPSPNGKFLAGLTDSDILVINSEKADEFKQIPLQAKADNLLWSPGSDKIISGNYVYDYAGSNQPVKLSDIIGPKAKNFQWDLNGNGIIYYMPLSKNNTYNTIARLSLADLQESDMILADSITDYFYKDGYFYVISRSGSSPKINIYQTNPQSLAASLDLSMPYSYKFVNPTSKYINLYNDRQHALYLIDPNAQFRVESINDITYADWISANKLLYNNNFEIWLADIDSGQKTLLTRISSLIRKVILHPSQNYVIFTTDDAINSIELDDREKRNITQILKFDEISSPSINGTGDTLYFTAKIGEQKGIYKLLIQ